MENMKTLPLEETLCVLRNGGKMIYTHILNRGPLGVLSFMEGI